MGWRNHADAAPALAIIAAASAVQCDGFVFLIKLNSDRAGSALINQQYYYDVS